VVVVVGGIDSLSSFTASFFTGGRGYIFVLGGKGRGFIVGLVSWFGSREQNLPEIILYEAFVSS